MFFVSCFLPFSLLVSMFRFYSFLIRPDIQPVNKYHTAIVYDRNKCTWLRGAADWNFAFIILLMIIIVLITNVIRCNLGERSNSFRENKEKINSMCACWLFIPAPCKCQQFGGKLTAMKWNFQTDGKKQLQFSNTLYLIWMVQTYKIHLHTIHNIWIYEARALARVCVCESSNKI